MDFEAYLISKKINTIAFQDNEPTLWKSWKAEFEQCHPNSFTVQKLNVINPIRRKYPLPLQDSLNKSSETTPIINSPSPAIKPGKPMMKPKPKIN
jgi:hypothetical protein